jgi:hypothetical protein
VTLCVVSSAISVLQKITDLKNSYILQVCFKLDNAATETLNMLKLAIEEAAMTKNQVFDWFYKFKNRLISVRDVECSGLSKKNI